MNKEQLKFIHDQYRKQNKYFNLNFTLEYEGKSINITDERLPRESNRGQVALIKGVTNFIAKLIRVNFEGVTIFKTSVGKNNPVFIKDNYGIINYTYKDMGNVDSGLNRYRLNRNKQNVDFTLSKEIIPVPDVIKIDGKMEIIEKDVVYDILNDDTNEIYIKRGRYDKNKSAPHINSYIKTLYHHCLDLKQPVSIIIQSENNVTLDIGNQGKRCITTDILIKALKLALIMK